MSLFGWMLGVAYLAPPLPPPGARDRAFLIPFVILFSAAGLLLPADRRAAGPRDERQPLRAPRHARDPGVCRVHALLRALAPLPDSEPADPAGQDRSSLRPPAGARSHRPDEPHEPCRSDLGLLRSPCSSAPLGPAGLGRDSPTRSSGGLWRRCSSTASCSGWTGAAGRGSAWPSSRSWASASSSSPTPSSTCTSPRSTASDDSVDEARLLLLGWNFRVAGSRVRERVAFTAEEVREGLRRDPRARPRFRGGDRLDLPPERDLRRSTGEEEAGESADAVRLGVAGPRSGAELATRRASTAPEPTRRGTSSASPRDSTRWRSGRARYSGRSGRRSASRGRRDPRARSSTASSRARSPRASAFVRRRRSRGIPSPSPRSGSSWRTKVFGELSRTDGPAPRRRGDGRAVRATRGRGGGDGPADRQPHRETGGGSLAAEWAGGAVAWEDAARRARRADVVVGTTASPEPVVTAGTRRGGDAAAARPADVLPRPRGAARHRARRRRRSTTSSPTSSTISRTSPRRTGAAGPGRFPLAEAILEEELARFLTWFGNLAVVPTVTDLRRRLGELRDAELARLSRRRIASACALRGRDRWPGSSTSRCGG